MPKFFFPPCTKTINTTLQKAYKNTVLKKNSSQHNTQQQLIKHKLFRWDISNLFPTCPSKTVPKVNGPLKTLLQKIERLYIQKVPWGSLRLGNNLRKRTSWTVGWKQHLVSQSYKECLPSIPSLLLPNSEPAGTCYPEQSLEGLIFLPCQVGGLLTCHLQG